MIKKNKWKYYDYAIVLLISIIIALVLYSNTHYIKTCILLILTFILSIFFTIKERKDDIK